jgi:capsular polysaccharide biosynthesis protein
MAEQAVWNLKRVTLAIPVPSVAAIRARAWMVLPPLLLGLLAAVIATQVQRPVWRGESNVVVSLRESPQSNPRVPPPARVSVPDPFMQRFTSLARSDVIAARVVRNAGIQGLSAADFLRHSSATSKPDSAVLKLSVTYRPASTAVRLTNAYALAFSRFTNSLRGNAVVIVFDSAHTASSFRPHIVRNGLLGGALGALVGTALVLGIAARRKRH